LASTDSVCEDPGRAPHRKAPRLASFVEFTLATRSESVDRCLGGVRPALDPFSVGARQIVPTRSRDGLLLRLRTQLARLMRLQQAQTFILRSHTLTRSAESGVIIVAISWLRWRRASHPR
jgi:hypothetical protein